VPGEPFPDAVEAVPSPYFPKGLLPQITDKVTLLDTGVYFAARCDPDHRVARETGHMTEASGIFKVIDHEGVVRIRVQPRHVQDRPQFCGGGYSANAVANFVQIVLSVVKGLEEDAVRRLVPPRYQPGNFLDIILVKKHADAYCRLTVFSSLNNGIDTLFGKVKEAFYPSQVIV